MENSKKEFERIVQEHKDTIYTVCYMFSKDKEEVDDLFQDILINLWRGYESFRGDSKISTWIWRVSLNTCITAERRKKGRQTVPLSMDVDFYEDIGAIIGISAKNVSVKLVRIREQLKNMSNESTQTRIWKTILNCRKCVSSWLHSSSSLPVRRSSMKNL